MRAKKKKRFNAFNGVFVPTFLSIIGVILFLRLGRIVGSAGILGTMTIILLAVSVIIATGLSLSSITTNIQIGSGGAYSIISKTLGLEVGGSVGIPLYLAQVFSVALYLFGFAEAWKFIFPSHPTMYVVLGAFLLLTLITSISTELAVKTQTTVFVIVLFSLLSIFLGGSFSPDTQITEEITVILSSDYWSLFALFFPATTGLMAGIALSGELEDPKRQIPKGVMWAIGTTTAIYLFTTIWLGSTASYTTLVSDTRVLITNALSSTAVLAGILAATFSSALTTAVAAPRLLRTMADNRVLAFNETLSKETDRGEPFIANMVTAAFLLVLLLVGTLDLVAPFLTIFFLITYAMINLVVFLEQSLGSVTFRPTLKVPQLVPLYGAISSTTIIFLISPIIGLISSVIFLFTYNALVHKNLKETDGDVRSGIFRNVAEWASRKVVDLPESTKHTWKPNILLPIITTRTVLGNYPIIHSIASPNGTMNVLGLNLTQGEDTPVTQEDRENIDQLPRILDKFGDEDIFTSSTRVTTKDYTEGICISLEAMEGQVFHPNMLFLSFHPDALEEHNLKHIFTVCQKHNVGVALLDRDPELGLGSETDIHVWIPEDEVTTEGLGEDRSYDLAMITAYRLQSNWDGTIHAWMAVNNKPLTTADRYLENMLYEGRFPYSTKQHINEGNLSNVLQRAPTGDLHIIPVTTFDEVKNLQESGALHGKTALYVMDSGKEDILG